MAKNDSGNKAARRPQRPISDKAFNDFISRIENTFAGHQNGRLLTQEAVSCLMLYLDGDCKSHLEASEAVRLVITILIPEIERAMARSQRARRPRKRCMGSLDANEIYVNGVTGDEANGVSEDYKDENTPDENIQDNPPMNRRERRLLEQIIKRKLRREARSTSRMNTLRQ